ncbi:hypothetical protein JCM16303_004414 [Sporobolomyces ruberrimus]
MATRDSPPQTPPSARTRSFAPVSNSSSPPSPLRLKSTFAKLADSSLIIEENEEECTTSEEESPIRKREASHWLKNRGKGSNGEAAFFERQGSLGSGSTELLEEPLQTRDLRSGSLDASPTSIKSFSSNFSQRYVPPHLRRPQQEKEAARPHPYLPSLGKHDLASFDRSSAPEPEDSFYTFSNEASFAFSRYDSQPSSPESSRDYYRTPTLSPKGFVASPPARLLSRPSRLDISPFERSEVIKEEEEEEEASVRRIPLDDPYELSCDDLPLGPVLPLASIRDDASKVDLTPLQAIAARNSFGDCVGCGSKPDLSFVLLLPCRHPCCSYCMNGLLNGASHKPPRPADCFACSHAVDSFTSCSPELYATRGGPGLAHVLAATLQTNEHQSRASARSSPATAIPRVTTEEEIRIDRMRRLSRSGRRRSSVVAAALTTSFLPRSSSTRSLNQPSSPIDLRSPRATSTLTCADKARHDSLVDTSPNALIDGLSLALRFGSLSLELPESEAVSTSSQWSEQAQGAITPLLDLASEPMPDFTQEQFQASKRSSLESGDSSLDDTPAYPLIGAIPPRPTEWPVVRLDNVPWSVTADEIEHWLPDDTLASALGLSSDYCVDRPVERVTLAVHILCNRVDGRTLNQAFIECASVEAAKTIVRARDGTRCNGRPVHVTMSSQSELLSTIFPTYAPGFDGLDPLAGSEDSQLCPLLLESELEGLLTLCRLESPHAYKAPERPYFNLVSIIEKLPFHQVEVYTSQQISKLYKACFAAVKTLKEIKPSVKDWQEILTIFIDATLRCPAFSPFRKKKLVKLAGGLGFAHSVPSKTVDVFYTQSSSDQASFAALAPVPCSTNAEVASSLDVRSPSPHSHRDSLQVTTASIEVSPPSTEPASHQLSSCDALLSALEQSQNSSLIPFPEYSPVPSPLYSFPPAPAPSPRLAHFSSIVLDVNAQVQRQRRRSSIGRRLNLDVDLVSAVAKELGIVLA